MSSLIPVHASEHVLGGVSEYLATAFSLANPDTSNALKAFLEDTERGMFHGPYVRVRLPYARAIGWDGILDWMPSWFTPYHHNRFPLYSACICLHQSPRTNSYLGQINTNSRRGHAR